MPIMSEAELERGLTELHDHLLRLREKFPHRRYRNRCTRRPADRHTQLHERRRAALRRLPHPGHGVLEAAYLEGQRLVVNGSQQGAY